MRRARTNEKKMKEAFNGSIVQDTNPLNISTHDSQCFVNIIQASKFD